MRVVGLDLSRTFAEIAYVEDGQVTAGGRVTLVHAALIEWAASQLRASDHVVLEATANTMAVVNAVRSRVARVVVANPCQVRLIAEARVKTDKIDAAVLAQLYASGFGLDPIGGHLSKGGYDVSHAQQRSAAPPAVR